MNERNEMSIRFDSYPENEQFARMTIMAFLVDLNPTVDELEDVKIRSAISLRPVQVVEQDPEQQSENSADLPFSAGWQYQF